MSFISEVSQETWQRLADECASQRPSVGKRVVVTSGRKYKDLEGTVIWHGINQYSDAYRYATDAHAYLLDLKGRWGWRVKVQTDAGKTFFIDADKVEVK